MSFSDHTPSEKVIFSPLEKGNLHPLLRVFRSALRSLAAKPSAAQAKHQLRIIRRLDARRRKKAASLV